MRRGVVSVILVLQVLGIALADVKYGDAVESVQRVKRAPYYDYNPDCPPDYYHHHRHPHPPFWPPPPPPPYWPPPPPPPPPRQEVIYVQEQKDQDIHQNQAYTQPEQKEPCTTCQTSNNAVSNAQSDSGQAIAIAIAKAKPK